jgi:uncharacterized membrane protein YccC
MVRVWQVRGFQHLIGNYLWTKSVREVPVEDEWKAGPAVKRGRRKRRRRKRRRRKRGRRKRRRWKRRRWKRRRRKRAEVEGRMAEERMTKDGAGHGMTPTRAR